MGAVDVGPPDVARLDRKLDATDAERRRLVDLYQAGLIELPQLQRRAAHVEQRRRDLAERRDALTAQRDALTRDTQLRRRVRGFASLSGSRGPATAVDPLFRLCVRTR
jgi:hypothetical protein